MSARIEDVHHAIDDAMASASSYSGSLAAATGDLDKEMDPAALKALAQRLLAETHHMQKTNKKLEDKLDASREDMAALQQDLDEVRRESMLDPLTKIFNRKSFDDGLDHAIRKCAESGEPLALIFLDIDHFKRFNDTYGHQTGDQVIRLVAMTLKSSIKGADIPARYGGEEFAAILPNTDLAGAITVSESIRKSIQAKELLKRSTNEKLGRVTASFGVASWESGDTAATLIERADRCLYAAKRGGRNRVVAQSDTEVEDIEAA
jgi:diguanylate cyclase